MPPAIPFNQLENRLDSTIFFRVHQAFIVNLNRAKEIVPFGEGSYMITLKRVTNRLY